MRIKTLCVASLVAMTVSNQALSDEPLDWGGFYVGAAIGATATDFNLEDGEDWDEGANLGVRAGYDFAFGDFTIGPVAEAGVVAGDATTGKDTAAVDAEWFASARLNAGYAVRPDTRIFATGGAAWLGVETEGDTLSFDPMTGLVFGRASSDEVLVGWTLGGGVEHMLGNGAAFGLEYLYADFEDMTISAFPSDADFEPKSHTLRLTLTVRF